MIDITKELIKNFAKEILAKRIQVSLGFMIVSFIFIIIPKTISDFLSITDFIYAYKQFFGVSFVICTLLFVFFGIDKIWSWIKKNKKESETLKNITHQERWVLRKYMSSQSQTKTFDIYDGVIDNLVKKGVLYKADTKTNAAGEHDFNMHEWAYKKLSAKPHYIHEKIGVENEEK